MKRMIIFSYSLFLISYFSFSQNVGIGTISPVARLHVADSSVLFSAVGDIPVTPGNPPISGTGRRMMWYPDKAAFRAGYVFGSGWDKNQVGTYSFSAGNGTFAAGDDGSVALGSHTNATGLYGATALGYNTSASGEFGATAFGLQTSASGKYGSVAMGYAAVSTGWYGATATGGTTVARGYSSFSSGSFTKTKSYGGFVTGIYNDTTETGSINIPNNNNRLFQVGNGTADNNRRNAMTVLQNGNVGIRTTTPSALLHLTEGDVVFASAGDIPVSQSEAPVTGTGRRLLWYADKAAFRAGLAFTDYWDKNNTGDYSFAAGHYPLASGNSSVSIGYNTRATGYNAVAMGNTTQSLSYQTVAMGSYTIARGTGSVALGYFNIARAFCSFVTGRFNDTTVTDDIDNPVSTNRIFMIGNGTADNARSNAMTVLQNGNVGIGTSSPQQMLSVYGGMNIDQDGANIGTATNSLRFGSNSGEAIGSKRSAGGNQYGLDFYTNSTNRMSITVSGEVQVANNLTVQNGKGIIRSNNATQQKKLTLDVTINTSFTAGETKSFPISWPETFGATPDAFVGNVVSGAGGWAEIVLTIFNTTTTGATLYAYNPKTITVNPNYTTRIIAIGAQ